MPNQAKYRLKNITTDLSRFAVLLLCLLQGSFAYGDESADTRAAPAPILSRDSVSSESSGATRETTPRNAVRKSSAQNDSTPNPLPTTTTSGRPDRTPETGIVLREPSSTKITSPGLPDDSTTEPDQSATEPVSSRGNRESSTSTSPYLDRPADIRPHSPQRNGGLINQVIPSAPHFTGGQPTVPPLRQVLLTATDLPAAENQRIQLTQLGLSIVSRKRLPNIEIILSIYRVPEGIDIDELVERIKKSFPDARVEKNMRFRLLTTPSPINDKHAFGQAMVGLQVPSRCRQPIRLAMLDSAVSRDFLTAHRQRVRLFDVTHAVSPPDNHGTSIASLLISENTEYPGLLPLASLDAINVFAIDENGDPETRTDWLLTALNLLNSLTPPPMAVNLSFGGQHSSLLEAALKRLAKQMHFAAAAGNDGTHELVYPAAYEFVHAVGAVDAAGHIARISNRGDHVEMWAPGEDVWTMDGQGDGFYGNGTSFAAPFATAALALLNERKKSVTDYISTLDSSRLVSFSELCP